MDGLTVSTANRMLETGKTISELRDEKMKSGATAGVDKTTKSFADTLNDAIGEVNKLQKTADVKMQQLATGENKNIPEVMISVEKADIALRLMVQVRNKIIEAYQDIMKMQV